MHTAVLFYENNQPFALNYNGTMYYYVLNAQGDVVGIMNSSKTLVATYTYDPWGKVITSTGTLASVNPLRYRGYYYDTETGFYYLQSRYYDPSIGRFINADSYASTDASGILSTNMFAYCENAPVNNSDATGEWAQIVIGAALGVGEQFMTDMIYAMVTGQPLDECFSSVGTYVSAAVSGAFASIPGGTVIRIVAETILVSYTQVTIDMLTSPKRYEETDPNKFVVENAAVKGASKYTEYKFSNFKMAQNTSTTISTTASDIIGILGQHIESVFNTLLRIFG